MNEDFDINFIARIRFSEVIRVLVMKIDFFGSFLGSGSIMGLIGDLLSL
jgi:hypothetical protein